MLRTSRLAALKHRPPKVNVAVGSNRYLEEPYFSKAKTLFAHPPYPNKLVRHNWRFFVNAGKCATGPPVGQEFTKEGLKAMDFAKLFNDKTKPEFKDDVPLTCRVQVYHDKTYTWRIQPPPTAWFLLRAIRKKRRETGDPRSRTRNFYTAYLTLEMVYEIAKMQQFRWNTPEAIPIETRVRRIAGQARQMGIAILGADVADSPVKGMTAAEYDKQSAKYRQEHMKQYEELRQKQLEAASPLERLHRPDMSKLTYEQLERVTEEPELAQAIWRASYPQSKYVNDTKRREAAIRMLHSRSWFRDMDVGQMRQYFANGALPTVEQERIRNGGVESDELQAFWSRDTARSVAAAAPSH